MYFFINIALNILSTENSSKIGNSKKKGKRTIKKINYKLIVGKNKLITKKKHKFSNIQCYVKNGLIYYINVRPVAPKYQIKVTPVFITIYVDKLLITKDEMKGEVIKSVPLVDIQRIDQHYLGTFCFDIILNQIQNKSKGIDTKFGELIINGGGSYNINSGDGGSGSGNGGVSKLNTNFNNFIIIIFNFCLN